MGWVTVVIGEALHGPNTHLFEGQPDTGEPSCTKMNENLIVIRADDGQLLWNGNLVGVAEVDEGACLNIIDREYSERVSCCADQWEDLPGGFQSGNSRGEACCPQGRDKTATSQRAMIVSVRLENGEALVTDLLECIGGGFTDGRIVQPDGNVRD